MTYYNVLVDVDGTPREVFWVGNEKIARNNAMKPGYAPKFFLAESGSDVWWALGKTGTGPRPKKPVQQFNI